MDGIDIQDNKLVAIDSFSDGATSIVDDLNCELKKSGLNQSTDIIKLIESSAEDFIKEPPDYNACLSNARTALETLAKEIANERKKRLGNSNSFNENKWGQAVAFLRKNNMICKEEEDGLTGVYSFLSKGAHRPVGLDEKEMARLGRSFAIGMCYFLIKCHNN